MSHKGGSSSDKKKMEWKKKDSSTNWVVIWRSQIGFVFHIIYQDKFQMNQTDLNVKKLKM